MFKMTLTGFSNGQHLTAVCERVCLCTSVCRCQSTDLVNKSSSIQRQLSTSNYEGIIFSLGQQRKTVSVQTPSGGPACSPDISVHHPETLSSRPR